ncbi:MAG: hypothetical protein QOI13_2081 [Paraburkholderia sp.]|jgi:hypothetical protein|nr:hypothetical protein [Paraburkholderia sp.]
MCSWRKLFLIVLLALSLPVQSFAAVTMNCEPSHFGGGWAFAQQADQGESAHRHHMHHVMMADGVHHSHHDGDDANHAHSCPACAACCFGMALPVVPAVVSAPDAVRLSVPLPPTVRVASFLTAGIDRPPRISLA